MNIHPSIHLDAAQARQRARAAQFIATIRADLDTLSHFIEAADAETLRGDYWCEKVQDAELAVKAALRSATHDGQARMGWPRE